MVFFAQVPTLVGTAVTSLSLRPTAGGVMSAVCQLPKEVAGETLTSAGLIFFYGSIEGITLDIF